MGNTQHTLTVRALGEGFDKLGQDFSKLSTQLEHLNQTMSKTGNKSDDMNKKLNKGLSLTKILGVAYAINRIGAGLYKLVDLSNNYVENLNLFTVQMGTFAKEGQKFISMMNVNLGINPSDAMRYMGFFMNLAQGMGVASSEAYTMSKNLTMLGYDLSSFLNIPIQDAMLKIQSGIAGELEPLRRVGYALSVNTMQSYLDRYSAQAKRMQSSTGLMTDATKEDTNANMLNAKYIGARVNALTDAEKVQLRYAVLLDQTTKVQGDMARTLVAPANQLRILGEQAKLAGMSLGNIFIPLLMKLLPIGIAALMVIKNLADAIAGFFGFELPVIDYSSLSNATNVVGDGVDGINDGLDKTAKKAKDLRAPFDELNTFKPTSASTGGGGISASAGVSGAMFDKLREYDDYLKSSLMDSIDKIKTKIEAWLPVIALVGGAFAVWKIGGLISEIKTKLGELAIVQDILNSSVFMGAKAWVVNTASMIGNKIASITTAAYCWLQTAAIVAQEIAIGIWTGTIWANIGAWIVSKAQIVASTISLAAQTVATVAHDVVVKILTLTLGANTTAWILGKAQIIATTIATVAQTVASKATAIALGAWAIVTDTVRIAQIALNIAMKANPIGLVIAAIGLLVTAFILLWNKSETFRNTITGIGDFFKNTFIPIIDSVVTWLKKMAEWIDKIFGDGNKKMTIDVNGAGTAGGTMPVTRHAMGGLPNMGQMFVAREAGAELVGNIGNRVAVANNQQIVSSVALGVANAVAGVMGGMKSGGGETTVNLVVDGDVLASTVDKASSRRGYNFNLGAYAR